MMGGFRNCWPLSLVIFILSVSCCTARHHHQKHSAVIVGAVFCDTCFQDDLSKAGSHHIPGATVAVECAQGSSRPAFYQEAKTDQQGNFKVQLPFSISKHVKKIEGCTVKLVKSSDPYCAVASTATSSPIHLKNRKGKKHIFSAGFFSFKPLKQPGLCSQQRSQLNSLQDFLNPLNPTLPTTPNPQIPTLPTPNPPTSTNPYTPIMPNLPNLPPLPSLPPLPKLPSLPLLPPFPSTNPDASLGSYKDSKVGNGLLTQPQQFFPPIIPPVFAPPQGPIPLPPNPLQPAPLLPNPFQPPPSPLIPNPFQPPTPPPSLLPPIPPLPTLPLVPGLTPVPSPPPPASLFPFPPIFPFPGTPSPPASSFPFPRMPPLFPGFPPAKGKKVNP
ncbi:hypothetical protein SOVF_072540 [Spinacia oleracea]|uniref:Vegetative cell wall protein gp1 n=1 Tax=Spinacia oleracea TaxID=3562 RepID=A0A9R0HQV4_SPIOL|nr:vegetative cell wall protein gp1 [Spinacia oleracea]KNA18221.1 hypothetical protein SOVF_072540 [Spinacia oleracea]